MQKQVGHDDPIRAIRADGWRPAKDVSDDHFRAPAQCGQSGQRFAGHIGLQINQRRLHLRPGGRQFLRHPQQKVAIACTQVGEVWRGMFHRLLQGSPP